VTRRAQPSRAHSAAQLAAERVQWGVLRHRAGEISAARQAYEAALALDAAQPTALFLLGALALEAGELEPALAWLQRAARVAPPAQLGAVLCNTGEAYRRLGRTEEALGAFGSATRVNPTLVEAHFNLGLTLDQLGRRREAASAYEAALKLKPSLPRAALLLIEAWRDVAEYARAIAAYSWLAPLVPESGPMHAAVSGALLDVFRLDEAEAHLRRALELSPERADWLADLGAVLAERGELGEALVLLRRARAAQPDDARIHGNLVYLCAFERDADTRAISHEAQAFDARHAQAIEPVARPHSRSPDAKRRLRVGYYSPDFREHPVAWFMEPLLREHDRRTVEVFCYASVTRPDTRTARLSALSEHFRDISAASDAEAARIIAQDEIDVLVDLALHSGRSRPLLLARRPAPVQCCWLAYPGTSGLSAMDYRLSDPYLDPPGLDDALYRETTLRLPETYWCYEPHSDSPDVAPLPALVRGAVTFGCLNSFKKVSARALELWARLLRANPEARLQLIAPLGAARARVLAVFERFGIDSQRIEFLAHVNRAGYLALYNEVDICLDPMPSGGGTTTLDSFWMGVPVVTLAGKSALGRAGVSIASNLGLTDLIARSEDEYVAIATAVSSDVERLAELRRGLRARMQASPLLDQPRFARRIEAAFAKMCELSSGG
jgi:predicted O-linked N-acetylglucosamine transferase (SPINDLY family)